MDKRVLLIGDQKSFMVTAISNGLEREEFEVVRIGNSVKEISHVEEAPKMWVFYLDGDVEELSEALVYCKDIILQDEIFFYLVGNQEELTEAKNYVTGDLVRAELERPLNIQKLVDQLLIGVQDGEEIEAKKRVLIVDDDPAMTRMIKNLLTPKYNVFMAGSGMNAITFLAKNTVDLILLDYEMPVVSGAKVLEMIRSEPATASIPVMFLTGKSDKETVLEVLALKPVKYLLKSMKPKEWLREIDEFFAGQKMHA
ncbi:MAG: response regulator [Lachnospiraceae bacterium]|nr:response regulator [Lachnospiraceae bacterium]